jgi:peptidoglycan/LPS O-acetylase OafA/YrhL
MVATMTPMLTVLASIAFGAVVGGFLARRFPMNKVRVFCAVGALIPAISIVAKNQDPVHFYLGLGIAVTMSSFMLIALLHRLRTT